MIRFYEWKLDKMWNEKCTYFKYLPVMTGESHMNPVRIVVPSAEFVQGTSKCKPTCVTSAKRSLLKSLYLLNR